MFALHHQTGVQYSTVEYTIAKAVVQRTAALASYPDLANHLIRANMRLIFHAVAHAVAQVVMESK